MVDQTSLLLCQKIIDSLSEAVLLFDSSGNVEGANPSGLSLFLCNNKGEFNSLLANAPERIYFQAAGKEYNLNQWVNHFVLGPETLTKSEFKLKIYPDQERVGSFSKKIIKDELRNQHFVLITIDDLTQEKLLSHKLKAEKKSIQGFIDHSPAGFAFFNIKEPFSLIQCNKTFEYYWPEPFRSLGIETNDHYQDQLQRSIQTKQAIHSEYSYNRKGKGHTIKVEYIPLLDASGQVYRLLTIIQDITERKEVANQLKESMARYRMLAANLPNGAAFIVDRDLRYVLAEGKAIGPAGFEPKNFEGKTIWEALDQETASYYETIYKEAFKGKAQSFEHHSHQRYYKSEVTPIFHDNSEINYVLAVSYDITERMKLEEELNREKGLLKAIHDSIPVMLTVYDPRINITHLNYAFEQISGWTIENLKGQNLMEVVYPDPGYRQEVTDFMVSLLPGFKDIVMRTKSGDFIETSWANIKLEDGRHVGIGLDISDRKNMEKEIKQSNNQLKKFNELLENLLYMTAHDLRSPLSNMQLIMELVKEDSIPSDLYAYFDNLKKMIKKQESVIDGLTEILEAQQLNSVKPTIIDLGAYLNKVRHKYQDQLDACAAHFEYKVQGEVINYDPDVLDIIVDHLMSNALKYKKPDHHLNILVEVQKKGNVVRLSFQDNGIGIDLKKMNKYLFRPFKRYTKRGSGNGIGLYITKYLLEKNGGKINLESKPGEGTVVNCFLKEYFM
ncbi:MAG: PAS domain-containing protein [Candidatus Cyclobacteriaceae bacterium M3_2C_046]